MHATKKKPTELVLSEVSSIPMMKYVTGNNEGRLTTVKQAYNLNQEAKLAERRKNGMFSQEEIVNVFLSIEETEKKDQQARKDANIVSDLLLGIVRRIEFKPTFNLYFYSRSSLIFMAYLAMSGKLILAEDATGEQFDLPQILQCRRFVDIMRCVDICDGTEPTHRLKSSDRERHREKILVDDGEGER